MGADGTSEEDIGMNPEERGAYMKKYREDHREEINARKRKYYADHKEEQNKKALEYYMAHREEILAQRKKYYAEHKEENLARQKKYREKHPENQARRLSWETCNILRAHKDALSDDPERLTTDFIMKIVKGGL
jgi:NAD+--asparagine ADP-ribosyltransferase